MKTIPLSKGKEAIVDDHWFPILSQWKWYEHMGYAVRKERVKGTNDKWVTIRMHRFVKGLPPETEDDRVVDHIDGNKLHNFEENLRICTKEENNRNVQKTWSSSSKYKGVTYNPRNADKPWVAQIGYGKRRIHLGVFANEQQAAQVYNLAAKELYGECADLNLIE